MIRRGRGREREKRDREESGGDIDGRKRLNTPYYYINDSKLFSKFSNIYRLRDFLIFFSINYFNIQRLYLL